MGLMLTLRRFWRCRGCQIIPRIGRTAAKCSAVCADPRLAASHVTLEKHPGFAYLFERRSFSSMSNDRNQRIQLFNSSLGCSSDSPISSGRGKRGRKRTMRSCEPSRPASPCLLTERSLKYRTTPFIQNPTNQHQTNITVNICALPYHPDECTFCQQSICNHETCPRSYSA
ncbi:hypothetical protein BDZ45DRAFT_173009 [Acephala macrosclerotiorum]|nr:hypothetical protein BDZ45DRAFT_173009 [Acephala macrosclerotiorum]